MESSNCELNRTTSAPVKHEHDDETTTSTSARLKTFSSEKIACPSTPLTQSDGDIDRIDHTFAVSEASPIEVPRTQEMERTPSAYRIPASVFEKSPSSSPMEWSTTSNESLFSIHTGNMSFTNDQFYMWRSGELTPPAEAAASTSDQMFSYHDSAGGVAGDMRTHEMGLAEATMLEVIKESENQNPTKSLAEVRHARRSEGSNTSNKSFAFSIMGADPGSSTRLHSSLRSNHEQTQIQTQPMVQPEAELKTPVEVANQAQSSWFSCFSCCSVSK